MKLLSFRVKNFRSVDDSGLITADNLTALIGANESGKTNLLLPLWKLNPAHGGQIDPITDYPRKKYNEIRELEDKPIFIEANFELADELTSQIAKLTDLKVDDVKRVCVKRDLSGKYTVSFLKAQASLHVPALVTSGSGETVFTEESLEFDLQALPIQKKEVQELVLKNLPNFVFYSNYGNLDSEIYLPQVLQNMQRNQLSSREEAKVRTLKVLFEFLNLNPHEILELGRDYTSTKTGSISDEQIENIAERKKERDILLQSASLKLTKAFRDWWKQGNYRFRFQADGDYFRIWVSDEKRPEDIELEGRSTGLQWFLSFYLVFLMETMSGVKSSVLLLDEPGVALHPIAQRDLLNFLKNLSSDNQIVYTTHSPFMIDSNALQTVKAAYIDESGSTNVIDRPCLNEVSALQIASVYPIQSALSLNLFESVFGGAQVVIVESPVEQLYLNAIKNYLLGEGMLRPKREILFVPGEPQSIRHLLAAKGEPEPIQIVSTDSKLTSVESSTAVSLGEIRELEGATIEDLFSFKFMASLITRYVRGQDEDFSEVAEEGKPLILQAQKFAEENKVDLPSEWRFEIAKAAKNRLIKNTNPSKGNGDMLDKWRKLFNLLIS